MDNKETKQVIQENNSLYINEWYEIIRPDNIIRKRYKVVDVD